MQHALAFEEAVDHIVAENPRYHRDAYFFLRDALDYTVKRLGKDRIPRRSQHVSGPELLDGIRQFALEQFGPMVPTVFETWGLHRSGDFGEMVFLLIDSGVFGRSDSDEREDFEDIFDFEDAFVKPFKPRRKVSSQTGSISSAKPI